jgi:ABC-type transport system substrate-binding protein
VVEGDPASDHDPRRLDDRAAVAPVRHRRQGPTSRKGTLVDRRNGGDFDTIISWSVETWGGHPDLSFFLDSWHSQFVSPPGKVQTPRNWQRWASPELDKIIEQVRTVGFDDPEEPRARDSSS